MNGSRLINFDWLTNSQSNEDWILCQYRHKQSFAFRLDTLKVPYLPIILYTKFN